MREAVYAIEHPDHIITLHHFWAGEEKHRIANMTQRGVLWVEKLGMTASPGARTDEQLVAMHCSRELIPLRNEENDVECFMALDAAERLLVGGGPDYSWLLQSDCSNAFLRFGPGTAEIVLRPYDHFAGKHTDIVSVPMYIQEAMIHPTCTLSVDPDDLTYAECDWREYLGEVQAHVSGINLVDVRTDLASDLVGRCSRPMLLLSQFLAPMYIPREWLARAAPLRRRRIQ
jgi:hypothetical protein